MIEVKISITAPELSEAITKLAEAISSHSLSPVAVSTEATAPLENKTASVDTKLSPTSEPKPAEPTRPPETPKPGTVKYTIEQLGRAAADLASSGKMNDLIALVTKFGVRTINEVKAEDYPALASGLIDLGAKIPEAA